MAARHALENVLRRDRAIVMSALAAVVAASWLYLAGGAGMDMHEMGGMVMPMRSGPWSWAYAAAVLAMWAVMMAAMMLPGAAPMVLLFATISRRGEGGGAAISHTGLFGAGYLAIWAAFSLAATGLQYGLEHAALLSPMMQATSVVFAGGVLIAAGVYQWTPLKRACLRLCRSPLDFIVTRWRPGAGGALRMGLSHGAYCVGCCWLLMLLLFVGGVMNLLWIGGIALLVLIEKMAPASEWVSRGVGLALVVWGGTLLFWP